MIKQTCTVALDRDLLSALLEAAEHRLSFFGDTDCDSTPEELVVEARRKRPFCNQTEMLVIAYRTLLKGQATLANATLAAVDLGTDKAELAVLSALEAKGLVQTRSNQEML